MDWACGQGRHSLLALERGWHVLAIDRNEHALEALREAAESLQRSEHLRCLQLDLESDALPSRLSQALAELGFIVVALEGSCNPNRSKSFHDACYGNMFENTLPDQIS
ncbi:MAG: methyltransferase domain-containing protein, partial [Betaproteobacteria bacterium]|nr:methyltransferase domain-containing protein [Betaproteobacteria bacterium]